MVRIFTLNSKIYIKKFKLFIFLKDDKFIWFKNLKLSKGFTVKVSHLPRPYLSGSHTVLAIHTHYCKFLLFLPEFLYAYNSRHKYIILLFHSSILYTQLWIPIHIVLHLAFFPYQYKAKIIPCKYMESFFYFIQLHNRLWCGYIIICLVLN